MWRIRLVDTNLLGTEDAPSAEAGLPGVLQAMNEECFDCPVLLCRGYVMTPVSPSVSLSVIMQTGDTDHLDQFVTLRWTSTMEIDIFNCGCIPVCD